MPTLAYHVTAILEDEPLVRVLEAHIETLKAENEITITRWYRRPSLMGGSSNPASKHGQTRKQGSDCPRNRRAVLD
jgi:hypothetical protein